MVLPDFDNLFLGNTWELTLMFGELWVTPLAKFKTGQVLSDLCPQPWVLPVGFLVPVKFSSQLCTGLVFTNSVLLVDVPQLTQNIWKYLVSDNQGYLHQS